MKLKKLQIGKDNSNGYKNLNNCVINFENTAGLTILIGNNGSGKSNLIEVISFIFNKIFSKQLSSISFKFLIEYEINSKQIRIHNLRDNLKITIDNIETSEQTFYSDNTNYPDKVFALYSGEELRLWENVYFTPYQTYYENVINNRVDLYNLRLNYINKYYWQIAVLLLYIKEPNKISTILNGSNIQNIIFDINTSNLTNYSVDNPNDVTRSVNAIKSGLINDKISFSDFLQITYQDPFGNTINISEITLDLYYILIVALLPKDANFKTINKLDIEFNNGLKISDFSEGQKKEILVTFITDVLASVDSIFLLDEPDSHIHPIKKKNLIEILKASDTQNIIMTTHSPTLIREIESKHFILMQNGEAKTTEKLELLKEITNNKWSIDSINNVLIANKNIILVEGKTDIEYLEIALSKLREYLKYNRKYQTLDFIFIPFGGASGLVNFLNKFNTSENQKVFAILDKDQSGKDSFCKVFDKRVEQLTTNDYTNIHDKNGIKIFFLPTLNNEGTFEIEDYFGIKKLKQFGREIYKNGNYTQLKDFGNIKDQIKSDLPEQCKNFKKEDFKHFKKLFDKLL
ncbi:ATP-dependent nuclease [Aliarcobacter butzleri]|uniref:ATP-dependent nuclease n=1 Tax=Aliarcobacter butzleri TaxID=28197 RepID=UPI00345028D1